MKKAAQSVVLLLPQGQNGSASTPLFGYLSRAALTFLCSYGLSVFLVDALSFGISRPMQALLCLLMCAVYSVMGYSRRFFLCGSVLGLGAAAAWFFIGGNLYDRIMTLLYAGVSVYNAWFRRLTELGYHGMMRNVLNFDYSLRQLYLTEEDCRVIAYTIIMLLLCALCAFSILRRARVTLLLFVGAAISTVMMYFGLCTDNTGFALMIASLCGVMALSCFDNLYNNEKTVAETVGTVRNSRQSRRELRQIRRGISAMGGFSGLFSALIALLILWIPSGISIGMRDIPSISHPMLRLENFVVAMLNGNSPDINGLLFSGISEIDSRDTATERRSYRGTQLFEVRADISSPIYLRNWTGIDYYEDSWRTASYERIAAYKDTFGDGFSPELLTFELLNALDPALVTLPDGEGFAPHKEFGYLTAHVHVKKLTPSANVLFVPSYADQRQGLLTYGTRLKEDSEYSNYYDGIFTGTAYLFLDEYSTISNVPLLTDRNFASNLGILVNYFSEQYSMISILREVLAAGESEANVRRMYEQMTTQLGHSGDDFRTVGGEYTFPAGEDQLAWRYVYEMSDSERERIHALADNLSLYYDYVYDNYLSGCESFDRFTQLAEAIVRNPGISARNVRSFTGRHEATMAIINFLSDRMVYTLQPRTPSADREYVNAAESFLFDTGEGYCVQYATSAVMLLRALGIPARYAEGYITSAYSALPEEDPVGSYVSTVIDSNAHAWIEVYYDYYGWVQYEATSPFYAGMYEQQEEEEYHRPVSSMPYDEDYYEDTEPYDDSGIFGDPDDHTFVITGTVIAVFAVILLGCGAAIVVILIRRRGIEAENARMTLISSACSRTMDGDARMDAAKRLDDGIMYVLAYKKLIPAAGEHLREFAARVDAEMGRFASASFVRTADAMLIGEFGMDISQSDLEVIARYYADLLENVMRSAAPPARIFLKYFYLAKE